MLTMKVLQLHYVVTAFVYVFMADSQQHFRYHPVRPCAVASDQSKPLINPSRCTEIPPTHVPFPQRGLFRAWFEPALLSQSSGSSAHQTASHFDGVISGTKRHRPTDGTASKSDPYSKGSLEVRSEDVVRGTDAERPNQVAVKAEQTAWSPGAVAEMVFYVNDHEDRIKESPSLNADQSAIAPKRTSATDLRRAQLGALHNSVTSSLEGKEEASQLSSNKIKDDHYGGSDDAEAVPQQGLVLAKKAAAGGIRCSSPEQADVLMGIDALPWTCQQDYHWRSLGEDFYPSHVYEVTCAQRSCWYGHFGCAAVTYSLHVLQSCLPGNCQDVRVPTVLRTQYRWVHVNLTVGCQCRR